jgi:TetR/AcrR family transcriptional regulator, mexJK operon transcriptional repressor
MEVSTGKRTKRNRLDANRIAELLDVAAEVFLLRGFAEASVAEMAQRANASKTTFYSRYPTKETLFLAVIERRLARVFEQVVQFHDAGDLRETLVQFGENLLRIALSPPQLALIRMINMESSRHPELAEKFFAFGPRRGEEALAKYLAVRVAAGELEGEEPLTMARFYMSLLTGTPIRWFVLSPAAKPLPQTAIRKHVERSAHLLLRAYGRG